MASLPLTRLLPLRLPLTRLLPLRLPPTRLLLLGLPLARLLVVSLVLASLLPACSSPSPSDAPDAPPSAPPDASSTPPARSRPHPRAPSPRSLSLTTPASTAGAASTASTASGSTASTASGSTASTASGSTASTASGSTAAPAGTCQSCPPWVAGRTVSGTTVLFDPLSGDIVSESPGGGLGGEVDLACDPWSSRVLVLEQALDDEWGELAVHPMDLPSSAGDPPELGAREHEVWVDGRARIAASPLGALVFEEAYTGQRWRLVAPGMPTSSMPAARPQSLRTFTGMDGSFQVTALTYGFLADSLELQTATLAPTGPVAGPVLPLAISAPALPISVRGVWTATGLVLLAAKDGELAVAAAGGAWSALGLAGSVLRVEQAVLLEDGVTVAALLSGEVDVAFVRLTPQGQAECAAGLSLPGSAPSSDRFFSRGLVPAGEGRVIVATSSGARAAVVSGQCPLAVGLDAGFAGDALRAPIDGCFLDE
ncbi:MAG: hypothetical protein R3B70_00475 [Polyangiaceae bacterium]